MHFLHDKRRPGERKWGRKEMHSEIKEEGGREEGRGRSTGGGSNASFIVHCRCIHGQGRKPPTHYRCDMEDALNTWAVHWHLFWTCAQGTKSKWQHSCKKEKSSFVFCHLAGILLKLTCSCRTLQKDSSNSSSIFIFHAHRTSVHGDASNPQVVSTKPCIHFLTKMASQGPWCIPGCGKDNAGLRSRHKDRWGGEMGGLGMKWGEERVDFHGCGSLSVEMRWRQTHREAFEV